MKKRGVTLIILMAGLSGSWLKFEALIAIATTILETKIVPPSTIETLLVALNF